MIKKKINTKILIIFISLTIFFVQNDIFRKIYFIFERNYFDRIASKYQFCDGESIGFLNYLRKKYDLNQKIKIINYKRSPRSEWFLRELFKNNYNDITGQESKYLILLNYDSNYLQKKNAQL